MYYVVLFKAMLLWIYILLVYDDKLLNKPIKIILMFEKRSHIYSLRPLTVAS